MMRPINLLSIMLLISNINSLIIPHRKLWFTETNKQSILIRSNLIPKKLMHSDLVNQHKLKLFTNERISDALKMIGVKNSI